MADHDDETSPTYSVPPVVRAIKVLRHIGEGNGCTNISKTSKALGINRTTLIRLLHTLSDERMIEWQGDGKGYALGVGLLGLAVGALSNRDVMRAARPRLADLAHRTHLSAHLGVLDGLDVVYMLREVPRARLVSNVQEGSRLPAHATTMGRMLLAYLPREELVGMYADQTLAEYSSVTATSLDELLDQLGEDRSRGIVWSDGNFEPMIGSCAVPIRDHTGTVIASINLSGANTDFTAGTDQARQIEAAIRTCADEISGDLGWVGAAAARQSPAL